MRLSSLPVCDVDVNHRVLMDRQAQSRAALKIAVGGEPSRLNNKAGPGAWGADGLALYLARMLNRATT